MEEKVKGYFKGRIDSLLNELDHYDKEAREVGPIAEALHNQIGKGEASKDDVKKFLKMDYDARQNTLMIKNLLVTLKSTKEGADFLGVDLEIKDEHKDIFEHIAKDNPYLFTFKSGKKEFVSEDAEEVYNAGLERATSKENIELAKKQIKSYINVDTDK